MGTYVKSYATLLTQADPNKQRAFGENRRTTPNGPEAQSHVTNEIYKHFKYPKQAGTNIQVPCCFHIQGARFTRTLAICVVPHTDSKGREISVGQYRCWSCGAKGGWNTLAEHEHLTPLRETDNPDLASTVHHVAYEHVYKMPAHEDMWDLESGWDWTKKGTTIKYDTLVRAGAKWYRHPVKRNGTWVKKTRLWLPANTQGEVVGHIGADMKEDSSVPYLNSPGPWASQYFFGFDEAQKLARAWTRKGYKKFCCVVEGPRDQLVMLQNNIPAIATLGANSWSDTKANMVACAFDYVLAVGDGDMAGKLLNAAVVSALSGIVSVDVFKLKKGMDPAKMKKDDYQNLRHFLAEHAAQ